MVYLMDTTPLGHVPQIPPAAHELYEPSGMPPPRALPDDADLLRRNLVSDQQDQLPVPLTRLPDVHDTRYYRATGKHLDLDGPGPWTLTGVAGVDRGITITQEGPVTEPARDTLRRAYPGVRIWQAEPA